MITYEVINDKQGIAKYVTVGKGWNTVQAVPRILLQRQIFKEKR